ncbi:hypothetical protein AMAG_14359 [Allomyces macrogynus ATCC 38327]|uniref:Uncharacterized protein n=1 Tax=Allomyces macrogynus (strain ATCC 38327) TaxID=578462 RepID=A0A0L0T507_ALLM3|nr:hypothetical protein AMAG_14359 [Allomyces macrogynus ATCC 38327]|eukprot:KNE69825.1 hypothetical protein AMAG_14359 [Allomyces macrogynus ATCC 38327]
MHDSLVVVHIKPVCRKVSRVRRPVIDDVGDDGTYLFCGWSKLLYETVIYNVPEDDARVLASWRDQITDEDFFTLELADPYLQRVVHPNLIGRDLERVVDSIVVEPPGPISRSIVSEVQWVLATDTANRHTGDAGPLGDDPDSTARFAAG